MITAVRHPAVPVALALLGGCAVGSLHHVDTRAAAAAVWVGCATAAACWREAEVRAFVAAALFGFWACGVGLASDASWARLHTPLRAALVLARGASSVGDSPLDPVVIRGRLTDDAAPSESGVRLAVEVESIEVDGHWRAAPGGVLITVTGQVDPATVDTWRRDRRVRMPALLRRPARYLDPGVPDQEAALARRGITLVGFAKSGALVDLTGPGTWLAETTGAWRSRARHLFDNAVGRWSPRSAAIVRAVILGDRAGLDEDTELRLQEAGTYHVLAISGGNIAILAGLLLGLARLGAVRPGIAHLSVAALLAIYAYLVGGGASVVRATMMAVIYLVALAVDHRTRPLNVLAAAAGLSAVLDPLVLFDTGAWLTYGATLAILVATPIVTARLQTSSWMVRASAGLLAASCAAELALFPIGAFVFNRVTAAGLVLNFAAIPLMTIVQVSGMALLATAALWPDMTTALAAVAHVSAWGLVESARLVEFVPWVTTRLAPPPFAVMAAYYAAWAALLLLRQLGAGRPLRAADGSSWGSASAGPRAVARHRALRAAVLVATVTACWIVLTPSTRFARTAVLEVTFIDVGQGDATLVRFPSGHALLVDAGGSAGSRFDVGRRVIEPVLWARGVHRLSHLLVTHGDADHAGGAPSIVHDMAPGEVWEGIPVPADRLLQHLQSAAADSRAVWRSVQRGDNAILGGVRVATWHPPAAEWERQRVRNDDSVVIALEFGGVSIVLPGDIEASAERALAEQLPRAAIRILQAPHHGSATSSTWPLLAAAKPALAVISAGRGNRYGHPHRAVLDRYRAAGAAVLRTDVDGAITLRTAGQTVEATTWTGKALTLKPAMAAVRAPTP
ncbi:MAG: DNA internalization-related competence protein ComEC/Rec2 [Acidobacteria bacterium]|nr:DNA internalization-related competence protein ComEC/Rec2 [Acidobacteriota bacterium]